MQRLERPTIMLPWSVEMCIPIGNLLAPVAAPLAALGCNLRSGTVTTLRNSSRIITRLKLHAEKRANHFGLCLVEALGRMDLIRLVFCCFFSSCG